MVMMAEEGSSRKQHLLSALSHVSRWEKNKPEAQQISSESLHSWSHLLQSRGLFSHSILYKTKKRHLHPQDSNKNTIIHCHPLPLTNQIHLLTIFPSPSKIHPLLTFPHTHFHQLPTRTQISQRPSSLIIDSMPIFSSSFLPSPSTC